GPSTAGISLSAAGASSLPSTAAKRQADTPSISSRGMKREYGSLRGFCVVMGKPSRGALRCERLRAAGRRSYKGLFFAAAAQSDLAFVGEAAHHLEDVLLLRLHLGQADRAARFEVFAQRFGCARGHV